MDRRARTPRAKRTSRFVFALDEVDAPEDILFWMVDEMRMKRKAQVAEVEEGRED